MTIGSISVNILANTNRFAKQITTAQRLLKGLVVTAKVAAFAFTALGAAITAGFPIAVLFRAKSAFADVVELSKGTVTEVSAAIKELGLQLDQNAVRAIVRANKAVVKLQSVFEALYRHVAAEFAPLIELVADKITSIIASKAGLRSVAAGFREAFVKGIGFIGDSIQKMVGSVLNFIHEFRMLLFSFRSGKFAEAIGLGFQSDRDRISARQGLIGPNGSQRARDEFHALEKFSVFFQRQLEDIGTSIEKQLRQESLTRFFDFLDEKLPSVADAVNATIGSGREAYHRKGSWPYNLLLRFLRQQLTFNPAKSQKPQGANGLPGVVPALAALEAGTSQAFAASRKNINQRIQVEEKIRRINEKQLAEQQKTNSFLRDGFKITEFGIG